MAKRTAIVLVHGVGDPNPGDLIRDFTAALAANDDVSIRLDKPKTVWLPDHSALPSKICEFFPVPLCKGTLEDRDVTFAEVFWGGSSKISSGLVGIARGLLGLIFGLQAVISGNLSQKSSSKIEKIATRVGLFGSWLLRGPVFAINVLLLATTVVLALALALFAPEGGISGLDGVSASAIAVAGCVVTCAIGLFVLMESRRPYQFKGVVTSEPYRPFGWSCLVAPVLWLAIVLPLIFLSESSTVLPTPVPPMLHWAEVGVGSLQLTFITIAICLLIVLCLHIVTLFGGVAHPVYRSLTAKALALGLQFGLWTAAIAFVWLITISFFRPYLESGNPQELEELYKKFSHAPDGLQ